MDRRNTAPPRIPLGFIVEILLRRDRNSSVSCPSAPFIAHLVMSGESGHGAVRDQLTQALRNMVSSSCANHPENWAPARSHTYERPSAAARPRVRLRRGSAVQLELPERSTNVP